MVENHTYIEAGTELIKDIKAKNSGYLEIIEENGIVEKLIIKIGTIIEKEKTDKKIKLGIVEKNEEICDGIHSTCTAFIEETSLGILVRPVDEYYLNEKPFQVETQHLTNDEQSIKINLIQHLLFEEGEKIESADGIDLVKTYLTVEIDSEKVHGSADVEFLETNTLGEYKLQIAIIENLQIKYNIFGESNKKHTKTLLCVDDGQKIEPGTLVAKTSLVSKSKGKIQSISPNSQSGTKILILRETAQVLVEHGVFTLSMKVETL